MPHSSAFLPRPAPARGFLAPSAGAEAEAGPNGGGDLQWANQGSPRAEVAHPRLALVGLLTSAGGRPGLGWVDRSQYHPTGKSREAGAAAGREVQAGAGVERMSAGTSGFVLVEPQTHTPGHTVSWASGRGVTRRRMEWKRTS